MKCVNVEIKTIEHMLKSTHKTEQFLNRSQDGVQIFANTVET